MGVKVGGANRVPEAAGREKGAQGAITDSPNRHHHAGSREIQDSASCVNPALLLYLPP